MPYELTLTFSDNPSIQGKIKVDDENLIRKVLPKYEEGTVTEAEFKRLQRFAAVSGDKVILEESDVGGVDALNKSIKTRKAYLSSGFLNILQLRSWNGDIYVSVEPNSTMGSIKEMFNLPDGSLRDYCRIAGAPGGNFDNYCTDDGSVWFSVEDFAKGNNLSVEEVKALFKQ